MIVIDASAALDLLVNTERAGAIGQALRPAGLRRRAWQLRNRCSAYDAFYLALAEGLDAELLTTDDGLRRAASGLVPVR